MSHSETGSQLSCGRGFITLLEAFRATGGTAPAPILAHLLDQHQASTVVSLAKLVYSGKNFCFQWRGNDWIPMFQFNSYDLTLKADAQQVRKDLPSSLMGWALAYWFATPNQCLDGQSPANVLDADVKSVLRAAQNCQSVDQFPIPLVRQAHTLAETM